jgi:ribosomal protein S18 acetylase RimI-like enzyme
MNRVFGYGVFVTIETVLVEAFTDDPLSTWLFPEASERGRLQTEYFRSLLLAPTAESYLLGDGEAAAVWQMRPAEPSGLPASGARLQMLGEALAPRHPEEPHLYLAVMGVVPEHRGAGLGTAMLRQRLERADIDGLGVYLEASSPRSRALYLRHGFIGLGDPVQMADCPPLWPMWRHPQKEKKS